LAQARKLVDFVENIGNNQWLVHSDKTDYRVTFDPALDASEAKCTCTWYLNHQNERGPCKHILAVQLKMGLE
jgi:predicted nucleic acid-binding Zn finger protein